MIPTTQSVRRKVKEYELEGVRAVQPNWPHRGLGGRHDIGLCLRHARGVTPCV